MGTDRAVDSRRAAQAEGRTAAGSGPGVPDGHPFRPADGDTMGIPSAGDGVRFRDDVLAAASGLAEGRGVGEDSAGAAGRVGVCRCDRLEPGCDRQFEHEGGFWGGETGPNPTDRGKNGTKRHLIVDGRGTPLAITHSGANVHDSEKAIELVDAIPPIKRPRGRPRKRPGELLADAAYDAEEKIRRPLRKRGIRPRIRRRKSGHGSGLGKRRWVVEACFAWLFQFRRLRVRYEKRDDIHEAFLIIGCILICWNRIQQFC